MHPFLWKGVLAAFLLVIVFAVLFTGQYSVREFSSPHLLPTSVGKSHAKDKSGKHWSYDWERDRDDYDLTSAQCDVAFPDLYHEIERATTMWKQRKHEITPEDIDISWRRDAAFRVLVKDGEVRITETRDTMNDAYRPRTLAVLHQINRAVIGAGSEHIPTVEFSVTVDDMSLIPNAPNDNHTVWNFARRLIDHDQDRVWLIPDFNFWATPSASGFSDMQRKSREHDADLQDKLQQVAWRGVAWTNDVRHELLKVTADKKWADVREVIWQNHTNFMEEEDMCDYLFLVHTEGRSWSGRLKYLLNCDSVPIVHDLDWAGHYYHLLDPGVNYVQVKRDFTDLEEKIKYYMSHTEEAQTIATNSMATFRQRYTSPAAQACYWRKLLRSWNTVAVTPEVYENVTVEGQAGQMTRLRGITFEEFA